jgi:outer membrane protein assembly factor BamB
MSRGGIVSVLALCGSMLAGCTGGGGGATCSFNSPATLAESAWPKFRHDAQNTGTVTNSLVITNAAQLLWTFPPTSESPKGPFAASPVINGTAGDPTSETLIYIGSTDGYMYAVNRADGTQDTNFYFVSVSAAPITSTVLLTQRSGQDALFFGGGDGNLYGVNATAQPEATNWPSIITGFISGSPTIITIDGTIYTATLSGFISGVCPNGVLRFSFSTIGVQSSPAVGDISGPYTTLYYGGDDRQLRAIRNDGPPLWSFSTSGSIQNAPVVGLNNGVTSAIYIADRGGFIFKVDATGQAVSGFHFPGPVGPMTSSPALSSDPSNPATPRLYVGSDDGKLYAVNGNTGAIAWSFQTNGPIVSSPAVATGGAQPVIVVGSNDGKVYFVLDDGSEPREMAVFETIGKKADGTAYAVRSSPAIGADGTVYVGADDGRLYAIGTKGSTPR